MSKAAPGLFGSFSVLDERPELFLELEAYAAEEAAAEREREAREAARQNRHARTRR